MGTTTPVKLLMTKPTTSTEANDNMLTVNSLIKLIQKPLYKQKAVEHFVC